MILFSWPGDGVAEDGISETAISSNELHECSEIINPAGGLPVIDAGMVGVDIRGHSFGDIDSNAVSSSATYCGIFSCFYDGD